jgi:hypothetical protein
MRTQLQLLLLQQQSKAVMLQRLLHVAMQTEGWLYRPQCQLLLLRRSQMHMVVLLVLLQQLLPGLLRSLLLAAAACSLQPVQLLLRCWC